MKLQSILTITLLCLVSFSYASESDKAWAHFFTDQDYRVESCNQTPGTIYYDLQPNQLIGKSILDITPLNAIDKNNVEKAFKKAMESDSSVDVSYYVDADLQEYLAKITAIKIETIDRQKKLVFDIRVTKNNNHT